LFDRKLAEKLSLNIRFSPGISETQAIGSATRQWRRLTEKDAELIFNEVLAYWANWVMAWGKYLSPRKFVDAGESDVEAFLQHLADQGKAGWQIEQAKAALKLLHQSRYPAPWSADWKVRQPLAAATASPERRPPLRLLPPRSQSNARTHRRAHRLQNRARDHSGYPGTQTACPYCGAPMIAQMRLPAFWNTGRAPPAAPPLAV